MRRKTCVLILAVVFVCLFASRAQAQKAAWSAGFPKVGNNAGEILVQGTSSPSAGWTLKATGVVTIWPKGGGNLLPPQMVTVNAATGAWSGTLTGLTSKTTYNIMIGIYEQNAGVESVISPDPKQQAAK